MLIFNLQKCNLQGRFNMLILQRTLRYLFGV